MRSKVALDSVVPVTSAYNKDIKRHIHGKLGGCLERAQLRFHVLLVRCERRHRLGSFDGRARRDVSGGAARKQNDDI